GPLATYVVSGSALGLGSIAAGGLAISIITASAFFIPYQAGPSPWEKQSDYVSATKTVAYNSQPLASGQKINQVKQGDTFVYEVEISATQSNLTNVRIKDIIQTTQATGVNPIESFERSNIEISSGSSWTTNYSISVDNASFFQNSILSNTLVITADVPGENLADERFIVSTQIIVGTPPEDCPFLWPVHERYHITQGPNCTPVTQKERAQGYFCSHAGEQAIDIGFKGVIGIPIYSTHAGAINFNVDTVGCKGNYATITSICNGVPFSTIYAHLHSFESSLSSGQHVSANQLIGLSGNSSKDPALCSTGPHLHYATWGLGDITKFLQSVDGKIEPDCGRTPSPPTCGFTPR
nr:peptidoglycan DD-metalloendopeptidase family protein [Candidatus Saccharibacteria bacterium]